MSQPKVIAITPGDPCGIGPEIIARAFLEDFKATSERNGHEQITHHCFVAGDVGLMQKAALMVDPDGRQLKVKPIAHIADALAQPRALFLSCKWQALTPICLGVKLTQEQGVLQVSAFCGPRKRRFRKK